MRCFHAALLAPVTLLALAACSSGDDSASDATTPSADPTGSTSTTGASSAFTEFAPTDYTYRLRVLCYCPQTGPVDVTVVDGAVSTAVIAGGPTKGKDAPDFARLTINDILDAADEAEAGDGSADVTWPSGSDHPTSVAIDRIAGAIDDEVTYTIRAVQVS
ncbi:DUF6174 domain-containing protein [Nocardioides caeni]|uniref:Lipoprotein n=1 Tax=Nocardioides caeni TaxID=574700 RepID=A0A4S8NMV3_9ACTN|nr:DUF6174 domain-containing protein [Nocardioides caeni]THV18188.1 hypothetical protein E9934_00620 [Nocardioides caeni]